MSLSVSKNHLAPRLTLFSCQCTLAKQSLGTSKPHPSKFTGLQAIQRSKVIIHLKTRRLTVNTC